jgi:hypothetical protein
MIEDISRDGTQTKKRIDLETTAATINPLEVVAD